MALIAKIDAPLNVDEHGAAQIHARPYKQAAIQTGQEIFVWTSDPSGGHGLAAFGNVTSARIDSFPNKTGSGEHKELVLGVQIADAAPLRAVSIEQIAPHRDGAAPKAASGNAPYSHALNKITSIEPDVADFVRSHFKEQ